MINGKKEIWVATNNKARTKLRVIAFSNRGRIMRANGSIEFTKYRQPISINGVTKRIHVFIAEAFIPKTEDDILKKRNCIDHITHAPENININDVRNLRWCTQKENCNFDECINNMKGREAWNKGKILRGLYDYTFSEEHKKKIAEARKRYWERVKNANKL